ncbi:terpene synthase family protein [Chitinophaga nivalis]|uniref:Terpene synthase family protein n=1 Tax=Chitinophaga nivalis TaxID=2991709 RepID=A0ABT3IK08_9BACT|nr:terpene synthase family protein [Chitinophaga nivalis]MCW3466014.1 terpene synthase family protein [Chitinophaga nivalis]MCW3484295.1 terpene synthase family protein [Chitinophaga nivalis]
MQFSSISQTAQGIEHLQEQYALFSTREKISLSTLFNDGDTNIREYCRTYRPNAGNDQLTAAVKSWSESYGIWLKSGEHYLTCATYLFPAADFRRGIAVVQNCAVDYYLNEIMGRDVFRLLPREQQVEARLIIDRMAGLSPALTVIPEAHAVEKANAEMLQEIRDTSPGEWFAAFSNMYAYHIGVTHQDCNASGLHYLPDVEEYIQQRLHTSGMPHIILLIEYCDGAFLDWSWLAAQRMAAQLKDLQQAVAMFGCLSNDFFSFEKEVIDKSADSNLVASVALNHPELSFEAVLEKAAVIVRFYLSEYFRLRERIITKMRRLAATADPRLQALEKHLVGLERCVQASWMWQAYTKRYKRYDSVFQETVLDTDIAVAV